MKTVAIFGASGFAGTSLVERLINSTEFDIIPIIHKPGSAWRLARLGLDLEQINILERDQVDAVLRRCTHVVNCTRGDRELMIDGLRNLLDASVNHKCHRFVHLSSVMVYGDPPLAEVEDDLCPAIPKDSYGGIKQVQDNMVMKAASKGLPATILVPPNISGPHSPYLLGLLNAINSGRFVMLNSGQIPCNLVDVRNLARGLELALSEGPADGSRYFVTDGSPTEWFDVIGDLEQLKSTDASVGTISRETLEAAATDHDEPPTSSVARSLKHLFSSHIREALRRDPLWEKADLTVRRWIAGLGPRVEDRLRLSIEGPLRVPKRSAQKDFDQRLCAHQLRDTRHSIEKFRRELAYEPVYTYRESMDAFKLWYRKIRALDSDYSSLLQQLYI